LRLTGGGAKDTRMNDTLVLLRRDPPLSAAAIIFVVGLATIGGFFFFEYVLGYPPCPLCLEQRHAFYAAVPLAALLWLGAGHGASRKVLLLGFLVIAGVMLWNTGLAGYHAGIEWKFWPGPQDCSGPINNFGTNLLESLQRLGRAGVARSGAGRAVGRQGRVRAACGVTRSR
jgi:disulfide bond formation protein DsbB